MYEDHVTSAQHDPGVVHAGRRLRTSKLTLNQGLWATVPDAEPRTPRASGWSCGGDARGVGRVTCELHDTWRCWPQTLPGADEHTNKMNSWLVYSIWRFTKTCISLNYIILNYNEHFKTWSTKVTRLIGLGLSRPLNRTSVNWYIHLKVYCRRTTKIITRLICTCYLMVTVRKKVEWEYHFTHGTN